MGSASMIGLSVTIASSPLRLFASSPLRLFASSPLRLFASSPLRLFASSPLRLFASSPLRLFASSWCCSRLVQPGGRRRLSSEPACRRNWRPHAFRRLHADRARCGTGLRALTRRPSHTPFYQTAHRRPASVLPRYPWPKARSARVLSVAAMTGRHRTHRSACCPDGRAGDPAREQVAGAVRRQVSALNARPRWPAAAWRRRTPTGR